MAGAKFRSGGPRVGCAKPRQVGSVRWKREQKKRRKGRGAAAQAPAAPREAVKPPYGLPKEQRAVWRKLAPHAIQAGTLTVATAAAFGDLCEAICLKRELHARIKADGLMSRGEAPLLEPKAHPLLSKFTALMVRVEAGQLRFLLTGTGKPAAAVTPPEDAFAEFDGLQLVKGAGR